MYANVKICSSIISPNADPLFSSSIYRSTMPYYHLVINCLPGALMKTSKHQQVSLAEDHAVAAAP